MRVHFICDHKWRDLPGLVAIGVLLRRLGHQVTIRSSQDTRASLSSLRPDCVVFNHFFSQSHNELARGLKAAGVVVAVLPTEGAGRPVFHEVDRGDVTDFSLVDLFLSWSPRNTNAMTECGAISPDRIATTGCPRFDFYRQPLEHYVSPREEFCRRYGLDPERPVITWTTQFTQADVERSNEEKWAQFCFEMTDTGVSKCLESIGFDFRDFPDYHRAAREASMQAFFELASARPHLQFILKPHPVENVDFYRLRIMQGGAKNIRVCGAEYIWDVLNASRIILHRHCTTGVEAWMWDKPTIEMAMGSENLLAWPEREAGSVVATDTSQLIDLVDGFLSGRRLDEKLVEHRKAYIREWFGEPDGRRCLAVAEELDRCLMRRGKTRRDRSVLPGPKRISRAAVTALARHVFSLPANSSLRRDALPSVLGDRKTMLRHHDGKLISRRDVAHQERRIRPLVAGLVRGDET